MVGTAGPKRPLSSAVEQLCVTQIGVGSNPAEDANFLSQSLALFVLRLLWV